MDLFDDRVPAVSLVGDDGAQVAGGEERVASPGVDRVACPSSPRWLRSGDAAHHQPAPNLLVGLLEPECDERDLGDLDSGDPPAGGPVVDGGGVFDGCAVIFTDVGDDL